LFLAAASPPVAAAPFAVQKGEKEREREKQGARRGLLAQLLFLLPSYSQITKALHLLT